MQASEAPRAVAAATSTASALDLTVDDAIVLQDSNRLVLRLMPCDVVARVAPLAHRASAAFEVELAQRLAETESPVAALDPRVEPRVHVRDGFVMNMWTYYGPVPPQQVPPADYAHTLERLHAGMRQLDITTPHFTDRVAEAQQLVASRDHTPALADADRELLRDTLRSLRRAIGDRGAAEQRAARRAAPGQRAQHEERAAVHRPRDVLPRACRVRPRPRAGSVSASTVPTSTRTCSATARASFSRWSQPGAGIETTTTRTVDEQGESSSTPCARGRRGRRSTSCRGDQAVRSRSGSEGGASRAGFAAC